MLNDSQPSQDPTHEHPYLSAYAYQSIRDHRGPLAQRAPRGARLADTAATLALPAALLLTLLGVLDLQSGAGAGLAHFAAALVLTLCATPRALRPPAPQNGPHITLREVLSRSWLLHAIPLTLCVAAALMGYGQALQGLFVTAIFCAVCLALWKTRFWHAGATGICRQVGYRGYGAVSTAVWTLLWTSAYVAMLLAGWLPPLPSGAAS